MTNFKLPLLLSTIWTTLFGFFNLLYYSRNEFIHGLENIFGIFGVYFILVSFIIVPCLVILSLIFSFKSFKQNNYRWGVINLLLPIALIFFSLWILNQGSGTIFT